MEKIVYETQEDARKAAFEMEKARLILDKNGVLSKKYNNLLKKRIRKVISKYKIKVY